MLALFFAPAALIAAFTVIAVGIVAGRLLCIIAYIGGGIFVPVPIVVFHIFLLLPVQHPERFCWLLL